MPRISDKLWLVLSTFFANSMRIGVTLVMARWVSRDDYGFFSIITGVQGIITLGDMNLPASLIKLDDEDGILRDTAVFLVSGLYTIYALIVVACCIYLSVANHDWRLWLAGLLAAATLMLNALYGLRLADLNKRLHFGAESKQNFIYAISQGAAGVTFALCHLGLFALVLQSFMGQVAATVAIGRRAPFKWPRRFSRDGARRMLSLGGKVSASTYASGFVTSTTTLAVNNAAGKGPAGDWGRGNGVLMLFAQNLLYGIERVAYPTLCRAVGDETRMRDLFNRVTTTLLLCSGFTAAWLFGAREDLVHLGLGAQWVAVPPMLKVLAFAIPAWAIYITSYHTIYALGKTGVLLRTSLITVAIFVPTLLFSHHIGVSGIIWAWVGSQFVIGLLNFAWVAVALRPPVREIVMRGLGFYATGVLAGFLMRLGYYDLYAHGSNTFIRFCLCSGIGVFVYGAVVLATQRDVLMFAWKMSQAGKAPGPAPETPADEPPVDQPPDPAATEAATPN